MNNLTEYEILALDKLGKSIQDGKWCNEGLVQLIELTGGFLNLKTIPDYAKSNNLSYNGVKKTKTIRKIHGVKFVIDNE